MSWEFPYLTSGHGIPLSPEAEEPPASGSSNPITPHSLTPEAPQREIGFSLSSLSMPEVAMSEPQAFLVVGHANWGKSLTIRALTGGNRGWVRLLGRDFLVRLMSNDDPPIKRYLKFIARLHPLQHSLVVAPYCPEPRGNAPALADWAKKYKLRFFVLAESYDRGRSITPAELAELRRYGTVVRFPSGKVQAPVRGTHLRRFISRFV